MSAGAEGGPGGHRGGSEAGAPAAGGGGGGMWWGAGGACLWDRPVTARVTCRPPVSVGSAEAQGGCPGRSHDSVEETEGDKREVKAGDLVGGGVRGYSLVPRGGQRHMDTHRYTHACVHGEGCTPWCHEVGKCAHARAHTHTRSTHTHTHTPVLPLTLPVLPLAPPGRRRSCRRSWTGNATTASQRPRPGRNIRKRRKGIGAGSQWCAGQAGWVPGR